MTSAASMGLCIQGYFQNENEFMGTASSLRMVKQQYKFLLDEAFHNSDFSHMI